MGDGSVIGLFVPVLFLVVMEISKLTREIDLTEALENDRSPLLLGELSKNFPKFLQVPPFGRFNFLHGANVLLLCFGLFLVVENASGATEAVLVAMIWFVWVLLPLFEVSGYEDVLDRNQHSFSFFIHAGASTAVVVYVVVIFNSVVDISSARIGDPWIVVFFLIGCGLGCASVLSFVKLLENEFEEACSDS